MTTSPNNEHQQLPMALFNNYKRHSATFSLPTLMDDIARDANATTLAAGNKNSADVSYPAATSASIARRAAPFLAAGTVLGALAFGPVGGMAVGLHVLAASVGAKSIAAGVGISVVTAAAGVRRSSNACQAKKRRLERQQTGAWAMKTCWRIQRAFLGARASDDAFRQDAELLRRFQTPSTDAQQPSSDDVYMFLAPVFATPSEFLSQVNTQLCAVFHSRHRKRQHRCQTSIDHAAAAATILLCETLQDAKMYIAHVTGVTLQLFLSLASTDSARAMCAEVVERIVYDGIYATVFRELMTAFANADTVLRANILRMRHEQRAAATTSSSSSLLLYCNAPDIALRGDAPVLHPDLAAAETLLVTMIRATQSPLQKLALLSAAFRSICSFADARHHAASNADIVLPLVCAFLIASPLVITDDKASAFVSEIVFMSFFTGGGGKGVEGYVLTTFQAAVQVIAAVDLSNGPAKALALFMTDDGDDPGDTEIDLASDDSDTSDNNGHFDALLSPSSESRKDSVIT